MNISESFTVPAPPYEVMRILLSDELAAKRMEIVGVTDYTHRCDGYSSVTDFRMDTDRLPSVAQRFIKNGIHVTMYAKWQGNRVDYSFDMHGLPAQVFLSETATESGSGSTKLTAEGELTIKVPIVGAKLESQAARYIRPVFAKDGKLIKELLNG